MQSVVHQRSATALTPAPRTGSIDRSPTRRRGDDLRAEGAAPAEQLKPLPRSAASYVPRASVAWLAQLIGQNAPGAGSERAKAAADEAAAAYRRNQVPLAPGRATGGYLSLIA